MKKLILFIFSIIATISVTAQSEIPSDSIRRAPSSNIKQFGGFLLDMGLMNKTLTRLPKFQFDKPSLQKDYNSIFKMDTNIIYGQGFSDTFSFSSSTGFTYNWGFFSTPQFLQMGTFKLKNGWTLHTYGDYNADGWKVPNRNALPWEKNNFRGAFEIKSNNGAFGVRIEVQKGRGVDY